jgi:hypothetical protein
MCKNGEGGGCWQFLWENRKVRNSHKILMGGLETGQLECEKGDGGTVFRQMLTVPWLKRLAAGLSPRRPGFDPGSVHVRFVVGKVALGQVFPRVLQFSPVNFISPVLHYSEKRKKNKSHSSQGCCGALHHKKGQI